MKKEALILGIVGILILVVGAGYFSYMGSTKHFENRYLSFDYPSYMGVTDSKYGQLVSGQIMVYAPQNKGNTEISKVNLQSKTVEEYIKNTTTNNWTSDVKVTKFTIDDKPAYNISFTGYNNHVQYETIIDLLDGYIIKITPSVHENVENQTQTESYKAYSYVVNTLKIRKLET